MHSFDIAEDAVLHSLVDERFRTSQLTAALLLPLREESAARFAILPFLLHRGCARYPGLTDINRRMDELYGAEIAANVMPIGDNQALILGIKSINDRFALGGEPVTALCAELLCDMLFDPAFVDGCFSADAVEQEKRCLIELIRSEMNEKRLYARRQCVKLLCEGEGYAIGRYGRVEEVESLTPSSITDAWREVLRRARMCFIHQSSDQSSGAAVATALEAKIGALPTRNAEFVPPFSAVPNGLKELAERMEVNQTKLVMGFRYCGENLAEDIPALRLMNALLGGSPHSLLFRNVREKLGLCYYCASSFDRLKGVLLVDSGVEEDKAALAREEILRQLDTIRGGAFSDAELEAARLSVVNSFLSVDDNQDSLGYWYVGQCIDDRLATPQAAAEQTGNITREQVSAVAEMIAVGAVYMLAGIKDVR